MQRICILCSFFFSVFVQSSYFLFIFLPPLYTLFEEIAASRSLFGLEKGSQYLVVTRATCAHEFCILTHLNFLVKSINTLLVFNHKWERNGLVVAQFFVDHPDVFLERPSNALKMCQIPLYPRSLGGFTEVFLGGFTVGKSLCWPFQLQTAVICEVSTPRAISSNMRYIHQCSTKWFCPDIHCKNKR